jgi:HD-GYP domain-containing protein (c-di-GMP phosphodiesterase class II)
MELWEALSARAAALGVPVWYATAAGEVLREPAGALGASLVRSAPFRRKLEMAARELAGLGATGSAAPEPIKLYEGCWCLPLVIPQGARRAGFNLAVVWLAGSIDAAEFRSLCAEAGLSAGTVAAELRPVLRMRERDVAELLAVLGWTQADLQRATRDQVTIDQFGERLAQAYEESNLLFRLARLLNCVSEPWELLSILCGQMRQVLPFGWVALRFRETVDGVADVTELAGKLVVAGDLPVAREQFDEQVARLTASWTVDDWTKLLEPDRHELARAVGSLVAIEPVTHDDKVVGALLVGNKTGADPDFTGGELQFLDATADFLGIFHENLARFGEQRALFLGTLRALTAAVDAKDPYTRGHSERVALLASQMAEKLELPAAELEVYRLAGLVHDVGKIGVPEAVLCKKGRLTDAEFEKIKLHPLIGHRILAGIPSLAKVLPGVLHHHERWDGTGYPHKLASEKIPLLARVLALADTFDAMSSTRSYRPAVARPEVFAELRRTAGSQFDPGLVERFLSMDFGEFDRLVKVGPAPVDLAA